MKGSLTILGSGTSQGVPIIGCGCPVCKSTNIKDNRLRSSLFISIKGLNILIDVGPDFRQQGLKLSNPKIEHILFTHFHRDHTAGLDDLRPIYYLNRMPLNLSNFLLSKKDWLRRYGITLCHLQGLP